MNDFALRRKTGPRIQRILFENLARLRHHMGVLRVQLRRRVFLLMALPRRIQKDQSGIETEETPPDDESRRHPA